MTEIKIYWCSFCEKTNTNFRSTRKEIRKHLREVHGVKGRSMTKGEGSKVSALTKSEVVQ